MKRSLSILLLIFVMIVVLRLVGFTYGYYAANILNNTGSYSVSVVSKKLSVEYLDGTSIMNFQGDYLFPGDSAEKTFMIKNTGDSKSTYNILIDNVLNEFERTQDLRYVLYINNEEVSSGAINNNSVQYLYSNKEIASGATDSVRFVFKYATTDEIQNVDMNKTISFRFNIDSNIVGLSEGTTISLLANQNVNNYRIYGNSVQNGTPSINTSVEIESVGDLVTDGESEYYNKYKIPVKVSGKNIINNNAVSASISGIEWTVNEDGTIVANGTATATSRFNIYLNVDNKDYYFSACTGKGSDTEYRAIIYPQVDKKNYIDSGDGIALTPKQFQRATVQLVIYEGYTANNLVFKPQLELGNEKTEYQSYVEPVTTNIYLDEPLRKIGDSVDYIDFSKQQVVRNVRHQILDDKITWFKYSTYNIYYTTHLNDAKYASNVNILSNKYLGQMSGDDISYTTGNIWLQSLNSHPRLYIGDDNYNTAELFKSHVDNLYQSNDPIKVYYPLAEEAIKDFKLNSLSSLDYTYTISVDTAIQPSNMLVEYYN